MDHPHPQDPQQSKSSMLRHREQSDESLDKRPMDGSSSSTPDKNRLIRRVRSPSRPRAWLSNSYKQKFGGRFYKPRDDPSFSKPGFANQRYHHFNPRGSFHRKDHFQPKPYPIALRERKRMEKERYQQRESADGSSPSKQNNTTRSFLPRSTSSRDKDMQFICQNDRSQSRERDHRGSKSKERERSRDEELPSTASQMATRDRAIQQKRKEIDEVYFQECEMFGLVAKMLIAKDRTLEQPIQSALQENLRDIGKRCVEGMEKFIEEYDSRESH
ncbi:periphilin-1-like [Cottoperca gobio]|uniref:Periphilin-1-like n=1 Tax=Cottoperca gobio TaxID=56716 RepID=A0A6J2Q1Z3_COTGO|nr:periphilin-1-like [Cottoperca gobio]XP_029291685.1 periphilin-1-like [Cottoperca gobio]